MNLYNLSAFIRVADTGSFSGAARELGKAQSAVSTAVANLEIDLGVTLFSRKGKFPKLTREGRVLLRQARQIINACTRFTRNAGSFEGGIDAALRLAVDEIISQEAFLGVMADFAEKFPSTELEILYGVLGDIRAMVETGRADIGILVPLRPPDQALPQRLVAQMALIPVAASNHSLARKKRPGMEDFEACRQLIITSRGGEREDESIILGKQVWMVENTSAIVDLVLKGVGWAFLPARTAAREIRRGNLVRLSLPKGRSPFPAPVYLIQSPGYRLGLAGQWMVEALSKINTY